MRVRVGSRESRLAVVQSNLVISAIKAADPGIDVTLVTMKTTGDIILDRTLDQIGGKGLFVKELDRALLQDEVDFTVHSYKDMPMEVDEKLPVVAVSRREDPRDALVLPPGTQTIDFTKPIGCSSARRRLQLLKLFPGCTVKSVRGNVQTRLEKLDRGEYSALVLAYAGLKRLDLDARVSRVFDVEEMLPAACQGILAVQSRRDYDLSCLKDFHDTEAAVLALAERSFVKALDGGCSSPVAAYAVIQGENLTLTGLYAEKDSDEYTISKKTGSRFDAVQIGISLAEEMKAGRILDNGGADYA